ncbi:MAG TPA: hypothetical protein VMG10_36735 [Gemmataceae bacterium]|nr:hypothetical protein [Gemmataceae bacterium]
MSLTTELFVARLLLGTYKGFAFFAKTKRRKSAALQKKEKQSGGKAPHSKKSKAT